MPVYFIQDEGGEIKIGFSEGRGSGAKSVLDYFDAAVRAHVGRDFGGER